LEGKESPMKWVGVETFSLPGAFRPGEKDVGQRGGNHLAVIERSVSLGEKGLTYKEQNLGGGKNARNPKAIPYSLEGVTWSGGKRLGPQ